MYVSVTRLDGRFGIAGVTGIAVAGVWGAGGHDT